MYPSPPPYDLHAQSLCVDQFRDAYDHDFTYPHDVCSYCQSFDHDVNSCPYYNISNKSYARLYVIIETMSERHEHFVSDRRRSFMRRAKMESNAVDDTPLIDVEEVNFIG